MHVRGELFLAAAGPICGFAIGPFPTTDRSADGRSFGRRPIVRPTAHALLKIAEKCARGNAAANRHSKDDP